VNADARLKQLLERGKSRGFVLYDEIDAFLPVDYRGGPELDAVLSALAKNGIDVVEDPNTIGKPLDLAGLAEQLTGFPDVQSYLREATTIARLTREEEIEFAKLAHEPEPELAKVRLIEANLYLVAAVARGYAETPETLIDVIQEGNIGLMRAVDAFDYSREFRFSTYATWWIRRAVTRAGFRK